ncbi:MAG: DUF2680 domain-containing protein [Anaerolineales bacterium]
MLKNILFLIAGAVIATLILGVAGFAYAQTQTPPANVPNNFGYGRGGNFGGMMGRWNQSGSYGFMHDYMVDAVASKLGVSPDTLEKELSAGKTMWQVAQEQGLTEEQFRTAMAESAKDAVAKMVADGVITQAQADWMVQRVETMLQSGFGYGLGGCHGGYWGRPGGRWLPAPNSGS